MVSSRSAFAKSRQRPTSAMRLPEMRIAPFEIGARETGKTARPRRSNFRLRNGERALAVAGISDWTQPNAIISRLPGDSFSTARPLCVFALFACYAACEAAAQFSWPQYQSLRKGQLRHPQQKGRD